jgi:hypothetical protein
MSWKWASYAVDKVIMEVSATTVAKRSANLFQTVSILPVDTSVSRTLTLALEQVWAPQDLGVAIQDSQHNEVCKEA